MKLLIVTCTVLLFGSAIAGVWYFTVMNGSAPTGDQVGQTSVPANTAGSTNVAPKTTFTIPTGWVLNTTNPQPDDIFLLNHPSPAAGISESEQLFENEGFIRVTTVRAADEDYAQLGQLLESGATLGKKGTAEDPYESTVLSQDDIALPTLRGRVYTHTNAVSGQMLDTRVTGVLQLASGDLLSIKAGYGTGDDAEQLRQDIFSIIRSLHI